MRTYKTAQVAKIIGVHPNTVRLYEELELIPKPKREANGYRIFTDFHIEIFKLARIAFKIEVLQNGLRKNIVDMVKIAASGDFDKAITLTNEYLLQIQDEQKNAKEAIDIAKQILSGNSSTGSLKLKRNEAAKHLQVSIDTLRNWEMNGLLNIKRAENGYRIYTDEDIKRLKIIRSLRCANYSLESILRMLSALSSDPNTNIEQILNTPKQDDDIICVCDKLLTSLKAAEKNANTIQDMLHNIKSSFNF